MANSCYNLIEIWGNDQVTKQVSEWNKALDTVDVPSDDVHRMGAIRKVFYPDTPDTQPLDLGSKWVHPDSESTGSDDESLGFQSAWTRNTREHLHKYPLVTAGLGHNPSSRQPHYFACRTPSNYQALPV